ncbi:unnamed protein product, partial [Darwinula stevensoni]
MQGSPPTVKIFAKPDCVCVARSRPVTRYVWIFADGILLGLGAQNGYLYFYRAEKGGYAFRRTAILQGSLPLAHLDWSTDSVYVRTQSQDGDVGFWDVKAQAEVKDQSKSRDLAFATHNCTLSYFTFGEWE